MGLRPSRGRVQEQCKKGMVEKIRTGIQIQRGLDAAMLMNPRTWVASGHVGGFSDPLIDCKGCKARFRADKLIEEYMHQNGIEDVIVDGWSNEKLEEYISRPQDTMSGMRQD